MKTFRNKIRSKIRYSRVLGLQTSSIEDIIFVDLENSLNKRVSAQQSYLETFHKYCLFKKQKKKKVEKKKREILEIFLSASVDSSGGSVPSMFFLHFCDALIFTVNSPFREVLSSTERLFSCSHFDCHRQGRRMSKPSMTEAKRRNI